MTEKLSEYVEFRDKKYIRYCDCNSCWSKDRHKHGAQCVTTIPTDATNWEQLGNCGTCGYDSWIILDEKHTAEVKEAKEETGRRIRIKKQIEERKKKRGENVIIHSYFFSGMIGTTGLVYIKDEYCEKAYIGPIKPGNNKLEDEERILDWGAKFPVDMAKKLMDIPEEKTDERKDVL
jgi:hypothetical protein